MKLRDVRQGERCLYNGKEIIPVRPIICRVEDTYNQKKEKRTLVANLTLGTVLFLNEDLEVELI